MRKLLLFLTLCLILPAFTAKADFFDDKVYKTPVPHKSVYNNDHWTLKGIKRISELTEVALHYHVDYASAGWSEKMNVDTYLIDEATGHKYPLLFSNGIPKDPYRYDFKTDGPQDVDVICYFAPIPESVKTVRSTFGLYDIEIDKAPVTATEFHTVFPTNLGLELQKGKLRIDAVSSNGKMTYLFFEYENTQPYATSFLRSGPEVHLKDPKTGKTYPVKSIQGITSEKTGDAVQGGETIGYVLGFESPAADGVESFDFIDGSWIIKGITTK